MLIYLLVPQQIHLFSNFGGSRLCCAASIFSTALRRFSFLATNYGAFVRCHLRNRSKGPARVYENSFIRHLWAPAIKCVIVITSTIRTHRVGRYWSLSNNKNSWWLSWNLFTSMVTFHCTHQSANILAKTAARKHVGSQCWLCAWTRYSIF